MGSNDLNQKYTIDKYCTRMEVAKLLGTNLIDPIWQQILAFRRMYSITLNLFDVRDSRFSLVNLDFIQAKNGEIQDDITKYLLGYEKLGVGSLAEITYKTDMLKNSLKQIALFNKIDASEITLQNLLNHNNVGEQYFVLTRYLRCLERLHRNPFQDIDETFLADYYSVLRNQEGALTSFYRTSDNLTTASKALVDREYDNGIPNRLIERLMENLLIFISNKSNSIVTRIAAIFYMFNYIKPFDEFNNEMACILAKRILTSSSIEASGIYVPIESIINSHEFNRVYFNEVQRTMDFTYIFNSCFTLLNSAFETSLDKIVQVNVHALDISSKIGEDPVKVKEEFGIDLPKVNESKDDDFEEPVRKPIIKPQTIIKSEPIIIEENTSLISEKELRKLEIEMLESDPFIKKGQAHFYVRHCTKGKFYTIQQYKKFEGCVYETARTSMDNLALRGYYRREQIKNKFVYTPIDKE